VKVAYIPEDELRKLGFTDFCPIKFKGGEELPGYMLDKADVVMIPLPLREITHDSHIGKHMDRHGLKRIIDHFKLDERRVAAYDCSDWEEDYSMTNPNCLFIRCNTKGWMKRGCPRSISWPWPVENFEDISAPPAGGFKYDISAHMWLSSNVRHNACASVQDTFGARADMVTRKEFYGYIERDEPERAKQLKAAFKESMHSSRLSLCPGSIHCVFPYRFFEALSAGRVPVLFCTDYVLPWQEEIPWDRITFRYSAQDSINAGPICKQILATHSDEKLIEMGKEGRKFWDRYLNRDKFAELMYEAVEKQMKKDGLLR
jgi:hypothetical protein